MYISINWLKKYLPEFELHNIKHLQEKLDTRLSEVEDVQEKGEGLSKLVVGKITKVEEHPTNKKLVVCEVEVGEGESNTIVCGAPNAREGLLSVVCLPGGSVLTKDGDLLQITERKMGDVTSEGMLCAADELGMSDDHNKIIELPDGMRVGMDLTPVFRDIVIEIENKALPHRPDAFSHLGIAREFKAIFKLKLNDHETDLKLKVPGEKQPLELAVEVRDSELCPRFSAIVMDNVTIAPSPLWLQVALSYAGVRPVNNVVDITNYVMLDIGQPMHAFDYDKLDSKALIVRKAKQGEKLVSLDEKERELTSEMLVVSSGEKVESIAGIMGGKDSEIDDSSSRIVLEAANWEMYQIRRASRQLGLRSEASGRFEKGISPTTTVEAIKRAISMIQDLAGGEIASELVDVYPNPDPGREITLDLGTVKRFVGVDIEKSKIINNLNWLGLEVSGGEKIAADAIHRPDIAALITIKIPDYRRDLNNPEDILEEVARMYGYENIPLTLPGRDLRPARRSSHLVATRQARQAMLACGLNEVYTYSMVGEELYKSMFLDAKDLLSIPEAISPELAYVRNQILPSLLAKVKTNSATLDEFGLFELGRVADKHSKEEGLPAQPFKLAMLYVDQDQIAAYRKLKKAIEVLSEDLTNNQLKVSERTRREQLPYLHPGQTGDITLKGNKVGEIGTVHPMVLSNLGLENVYVAAAEITFDALVKQINPEVVAQPVSNFPATTRDISFWVEQGSNIGGSIDDSLHRFLDIVDVRLIDTYEDEKSEKQSITLRYVIQSLEHTLDQAELQEIEAELRKSAEHFGLIPRD